MLQWSGKPIRRDVFDRLLPELSSLMGPQIIDVFDAYRLLESLLDDGKQAAEVRQAGDIDRADHLDLGLSQNMKHVFATIEDLERKIGWKGDQRTYRDF